MPIGLGFAPLGSSLFGYGSIDEAVVPSKLFYVDPLTGQQANARAIDGRTRDYVFNADGSSAGMRGVYQLVQLTAQTVKGSSAVASLGLDTSKIQVINERTQQKVEDAYRDGFDPLVKQGLISLGEITVQRATPYGFFVLVKFTDLTTGEEQSIRL